MQPSINCFSELCRIQDVVDHADNDKNNVDDPHENDTNEDEEQHGETTTTTLVESSSESTPQRRRVILCDMGYGLPKETRPRREKILAMARQLVNFLWWQQTTKMQRPFLSLEIVDCPSEDILTMLLSRMKELWNQQKQPTDSEEIPFPTVIFSNWSDYSISTNNSNKTGFEKESEKHDMVYLSPDATRVLDPSHAPPNVMVVGLLIDRRSIQLNRSLIRAESLKIPPFQLPLAGIQFGNADDDNNDNDNPPVLNSSEPLNVDCVLEILQQWHWNYDHYYCFGNMNPNSSSSESCYSAVLQGLESHAQRHPRRILHKVQCTITTEDDDKN